MGYQTEFDGVISSADELTEFETMFLHKFAETRRMKRGKGPYFVGGSGFMGQGRDPDIEDYNRPPEDQPELWCHWVPTDGGDGIEWDGGEKFCDAEVWMKYIIDHFIGPNPIIAEVFPELAERFPGHRLSGSILAQGEEIMDRWSILVEPSGRVWVFDGSGPHSGQPKEIVPERSREESVAIIRSYRDRMGVAELPQSTLALADSTASS